MQKFVLWHRKSLARIDPPDPNNSVLVLQQAVPRGDVRFARANILFHDKHVIDLYHRICALYRMG